MEYEIYLFAAMGPVIVYENVSLLRRGSGSGAVGELLSDLLDCGFGVELTVAVSRVLFVGE